MFISEIYQSKQGEGRLTGTPSVFVRVSGCNLRCDFCDTPYASWAPEGQTFAVNDLVEKVIEFDCEHVVMTGGEPMIFQKIPELCRQLSNANKHITIETAGTCFADVDCDLMSISPKLSNSTPSESRAGRWRQQHEKARYRPDVVQKLMDNHDYQLKFVVATESDCDEAREFLDQLNHVRNDNVLMMPCGTTIEELDEICQWLEPLCQQIGFQLCDRMHIRWYGNKRGT